jgi:hypothetical protein
MRRVNRREERNVLAETIQSPTRKSLEGAALARVVAGRGKFGPKILWSGTARVFDWKKMFPQTGGAPCSRSRVRVLCDTRR